ncbi:MAG: hypothetical protein E6Q97_06580 [Desulfurellales bacterium]|nr:MAG: hypothetical protein E6Q97_06580 [Desulfurellales bacterium]
MTRESNAVYLAGKFQDREKIKELAQALRASGFKVMSSWHDVEYNMDETAETRQRRITSDAERDLGEIYWSGIFILLPKMSSWEEDKMYAKGSIAGPESSGRYTELGYAFAIGCKVLVVGEHANIFTRLATVQRFATVDDLLLFLGVSR